MTPETLVKVLSFLMSVGFEYVPGLAVWFEKLLPVQKRLLMIAAMFVIVAGSFGLSCAGLMNVFACTVGGAWDAVALLLEATAINQGVHLITKRRKS